MNGLIPIWFLLFIINAAPAFYPLQCVSMCGCCLFNEISDARNILTYDVQGSFNSRVTHTCIDVSRLGGCTTWLAVFAASRRHAAEIRQLPPQARNAAPLGISGWVYFDADLIDEFVGLQSRFITWLYAII